MTRWRPRVGIAAAACLVAAAILPAAIRPADAEAPGNAGRQVYERANCVGCHKWTGAGGGGYGGAALSLRETQLSRDQIVETVTCGRPGTGMPHFVADPYRGGACYGLTPDDVRAIMPPAANLVLRPEDIDAVADYVVTTLKGRGEPTLADCVAFFGDSSRVCDTYRANEGAPSRHAMPTPTTTQ